MHIHLKLKLETLSAEQRLIRREELRWRKYARKAKEAAHKQEHQAKRAGLHQHRCIDVRRHARINYLAYGFLRGRTYQQIENKAYVKPDWDKVLKVAERFAEIDVGEIRQRFSGWKSVD